MFLNRESALLLASTVPSHRLFLYWYDGDYIQGFLRKNEKKLVRFFNFIVRYIVDVLSQKSLLILLIASFPLRWTKMIPQIQLGLLHALTHTSELTVRAGYERSTTTNETILIFPFICSNIPATPAYGVYISQLIKYSKDCGSCQEFLDRRLLLTRQLLNRRFHKVKLKSSLRKCYGRHHDMVYHYGTFVFK